MNKNFIEHEIVEGANQVNLNLYSFIRFSERRQCYIFKKRAKPLREDNNNKELCPKYGGLK